ncbi:MAG: hypothetical protein PHI35_00360 [Victivallaceae bacterium]|nr:hypothetical protein [Victivallaceae bacterium]
MANYYIVDNTTGYAEGYVDTDGNIWYTQLANIEGWKTLSMAGSTVELRAGDNTFDSNQPLWGANFITGAGYTGTVTVATTDKILAAGGGNSTSTYNGSISISNGTFSANLFAASNGSAKTTDGVVSISGGSLTGNIYGGSSWGGTSTQSTITVSNGSVTGNIYGGSFRTGTVDNVLIEVSGGSINGIIYGGSTATGAVGTSVINISNGTYGNVYAGGAGAATNAKTTITVTGGTQKEWNYIYGGGNNTSSVVTESNIVINGGTVQSIFGLNAASTIGTLNIDIAAGRVLGAVSAGGFSTGSIDTANITIDGGLVSGIILGGCHSTTTFTNTVVNNANITLNAGNVSTVYGGGQNDTLLTSVITVNGGGINIGIYAGARGTGTVGSSTIYINGNTFAMGSTAFFDCAYNSTVAGETVAKSAEMFLNNVSNGKRLSGARFRNLGKLTMQGDTAIVITTTDLTSVGSSYALAFDFTGRNSAVTAAFLTVDAAVTTQTNLKSAASITATLSDTQMVTAGTYTMTSGLDVSGFTSVTLNDTARTVGTKYFYSATNTNFIITGGDSSTLAVVVSDTGANDYKKLSDANSSLEKINYVDDTTTATYAGTLDATYTGANTAFFAAKGEAATGDKVILDFNGATANKAVCGGGAAGATIAAELEVNVVGGSANFVYGGGQSFNTGAATVNVNAGGTVGTVYGGANLANGATGLGATTLNIAGKLTGSAFGGNRVNTTGTVNAGNVTVNVADGAAIGGGSFVAGAGFVLGGGTLNVTDVTVNWDGGAQTGSMANGRGLVAGGIAGTNAKLNVTTTTTDITAGTAYYIYGGVWAQNQATGNVGTTNITISGGDHGVVYGGGIALGDNTSSTVGNVNITISGVTQLSSVFAGGLQSSQAATITGAAQVTISDTVSVKKFITGEGANCTITLDGFTGSMGGLAGFGKVEVKGATAMTQEFQMVGADTSSWAFDLTGNTADELMTWKGNSTNSFAGDTIALTFDATDTAKSWTLVSVNGSRGEDILDLTGATITYNGSATSDWTLTRQGEGESWSLVLAKA